MTRSTMIILAPWILFSVALVAIAIRLARSRGGPGRRESHSAEPEPTAGEAQGQDEPGD